MTDQTTCDVSGVFLKDSESDKIVDENVKTLQGGVLLALPVPNQLQEDGDTGSKLIELFDVRT